MSKLQEVYSSDTFRVFFTATPQVGFAPMTVSFQNLSGDISLPIQDVVGDTNPIQDILEA